MHGPPGEERKRCQGMCSVPATTTSVDAAAATAAAVDCSLSAPSSPGSFVKDGRKIRVGDCALFQAGNSPPFIGIIRSLASGEEYCLKLGVNWLYRPADIKLSKGILLEAAPNEVFYSFHKDEISAASLLHPCKVAFLRKGVELPPGTSSFVCRRVYDIQNKCLWWLTDQDYINERQEEVDQLLDKTRQEMHAAVQSGARSPKPLNVPTSTQQLKPGSDSVQNTPTSFPSQGKSKKRERGEQGHEPIKRERSSKADDGDSSQYKLASMIKAEIAKITENGGLINSEGVEKLVNLMHLDKAERKIDLAVRIMLADVIAATDKLDCLERFVQLRGVSVFDDWLQEVQKGKLGDGNNLKENDKSVEEFLLALLRALDNLPVNLHALQTSNVGKSVNHLRSNKNVEIQKKARTLVDTWKKRVEAEMKINDAKSGSNQSVQWPSKSNFSEVSHGGNRRGGSSEVAIKSIITQPSALKTGSTKLSHVDAVTKLASASPGSMKLRPSSPVSATTGSKDSHYKMAGSSATSDVPMTTVKEEKSSSSSQSQNNSQSYSSDHAKTALKEDARSSTAGSMNANRTSTGASRTRRSSNGFLGSGVSTVQKESVLGKPGYLNRNVTPDKILQAGPSCEKPFDMLPADHGRLIVRLPNPGCSPARSASGGSFEDPSTIVSRASSPAASDTHEHHDRKAKGKSDDCGTNVAGDAISESWQSNDVKNVNSGAAIGDRYPAAVLDEERSRNTETMNPMDSSKAINSASGNEKGTFLPEPESGKPFDASFNSINALIESFVEASSSLSVGDDQGMNLLASVAAGEMSKSEPGSPNGSPGMDSPIREENFMSKSSNSRSSHDVVTHGHGQLADNADCDLDKQGKSVIPLPIKDASHQVSNPATGSISGENRGMPVSKHSDELPSSSGELNKSADLCVKSDCKDDEVVDGCGTGSASAANGTSPKDFKEELPEGEGTNLLCERRTISIGGENVDGMEDSKPTRNGSPEDSKMVGCPHTKVIESSITTSDIVHGSLGDQCDIDQATTCTKVEKEAVEESSSCQHDEMDSKKMDVVQGNVHGCTATIKQLPPVGSNNIKFVDGSGEDAVALGSGCIQSPNHAEESMMEKSDCMEAKIKVDPADDERTAHTTEINNTGGSIVENSERKEVECCTSGSAHEESPAIPPQGTDQCMKSAGFKLSSIEANEAEECLATAEAASLSNATVSDMAAKLDFDLNEGFPVDEGNQHDPAISVAPGCSAVHMPSPMPYPVSTLPGSLTASITVAAAAKGAFVHPENLLKSKGELGWKGSAATSAFRPAEPRKVLHIPLSTTDVALSDASAGKQPRLPLDIDLNAPGEKVLDDMMTRSSVQESESGSGTATNYRELGHSAMLNSSSAARGAGGLDLDLNRADESVENGQHSVSTSRRLEVPVLPVRSSASSGFPNGEVNSLRDFDLNNGPGLDEVGAESAPRNQFAKSSGPFPSHVSGLRMNNSELGGISSWFPTGTSYPAVTIPSFLQDRGEQHYPFIATAGAQRILGPATGGTFGGDLYRGGPVLSSSPAMAFSPAAPFPYPGYPFGNSFPLASTSFSVGSTAFMDTSSVGGQCFPAIPSQLVGQASAVSSHYPRPYVISLPESSTSNGAESNRKWGKQGLDLNAGPGSGDVVGREDRLNSLSGQLSVANPQALAEEQARIYQATSGAMKRKDIEGGWDADRFSYKQPSWQ